MKWRLVALTPDAIRQGLAKAGLSVRTHYEKCKRTTEMVESPRIPRSNEPANWTATRSWKMAVCLDEVHLPPRAHSSALCFSHSELLSLAFNCRALLYGCLWPWWPHDITESQCKYKSAGENYPREQNRLFVDVHDSSPLFPANVASMSLPIAGIVPRGNRRKR
jgi:hypothetical protein